MKRFVFLVFLLWWLVPPLPGAELGRALNVTISGRLLAPTNFFNTNAAAVYRGLTNAGFGLGGSGGSATNAVLMDAGWGTNNSFIGSTNYGSPGKTNWTWMDAAGWHNTNNSAAGLGIDISGGVIFLGNPQKELVGNTSGVQISSPVTSGSTNWWLGRFGASGNKIYFGDDGVTSHIQSSHKLAIHSNQGSSPNTNATPDIVISSGLVGIGTQPTSTAKLEVSGHILATTGLLINSNSWTNVIALTEGQSQLLASNGTPHIIWRYAGDLHTNDLTQAQAAGGQPAHASLTNVTTGDSNAYVGAFTGNGVGLSNLNAANLYGTATLTNLIVDTLTLINPLEMPFSWTNLVNVPAGFADGTDDGSGGGLDPRIASSSGTLTSGSNTFAAPIFQSSSLTASTVIGTDGGKNIVSYAAGAGISITGGEISATGGGAADGSPGVLTNQFTTNAVGSAIVGPVRFASTIEVTNGAPGVGITNRSDGSSTFSGPMTNLARIFVADGTALLPSISFTSDADAAGSGFYRSGANQVSISLNGLQAIRLAGKELGLVASSGFSELTFNAGDGSETVMTLDAPGIVQIGLDAGTAGSRGISFADSTTANTVGANATIAASQGTGTAGSGSLIFQTGGATTAGAGATVLTNQMQLYPDGRLGVVGPFNSTNGFRSTNNIAFHMPTNAQTDGQVLTASGTSGITRWADSAGGGLSDGDKGDITVSASGATWTVDANSIALTTDTTGNYAAGDAEAGAALTGDSATSFFSTGTLEAARLPAMVYEFALSDETTAITTGTAKVTWRTPFAMTVTAVRASLSTTSSSGIPTVDINEGGTTILSTKLTIDASEKTSTTAAAAAVISDTALADDAEITFDVDVAGTGAAGLKIKIFYTR